MTADQGKAFIVNSLVRSRKDEGYAKDTERENCDSCIDALVGIGELDFTLAM
jgi:hypothetical protein